MRALLLIALVFLLTACSSTQVSDPHKVSDQQQYHQYHNPLEGCEFFTTQQIPFPQIEIWELLGKKQSQVDADGRIFEWIFLHDPFRPHMPVAGIAVKDKYGKSPTRFSWQVKDTIYTIRPATNEMICAKPIKYLTMGATRVALDLSHLRQKILALP